MRARKYRGRDERGCWHYGWLAETNDGTFYIIENDEGWTDDGFHNDDFSGWYKVLEKTIGQFIGLCDWKGKEIYEDDVIEGDHNIRHVIRYKETDASFFAYLLPETKFSPKGGFDKSWIDEFGKEVIGNIHDNPELLRGV